MHFWLQKFCKAGAKLALCTTVLPKQFKFGGLGSQLCGLESHLSVLAATKKNVNQLVH